MGAVSWAGRRKRPYQVERIRKCSSTLTQTRIVFYFCRWSRWTWCSLWTRPPSTKRFCCRGSSVHWRRNVFIQLVSFFFFVIFKVTLFPPMSCKHVVYVIFRVDWSIYYCFVLSYNQLNKKKAVITYIGRVRKT